MNRKEEEKLIIQYFRKHCIDFPKGRLIPSESPDFILKISPHRSIGIELTRLVEAKDPFAAIRNAIVKKEGKLHLYTHMHLSGIWLIIHAEDALADLNFKGRELEDFGLITSFDRVFFMDLFSNRVFSVI